MHWISEAQTAAAAKVSAALVMPMPEGRDALGYEGDFNPWSLMPCLYGGYSSEFDDLAIEVLHDLQDHTHKRDDLASEMFREMLCVLDLCEYGTSPRVCFPTPQFEALLSDLIAKWDAYRTLAWGRH